MDPVAIPDKTVHQNDWFETAYHFGPFTSTQGNLPFRPCISCRIQYKSTLNGSIGYESSSILGDITTVDAANYEFDIPAPRYLPLPPGSWYWEFETFESANCAGPSRTFYKSTLTVNET